MLFPNLDGIHRETQKFAAARTADLACSRSGSARTRFGVFFFRDFDLTRGSFDRHPCYGAANA